MTIGIDSNQAAFDTVEETGGSVTVDIHHQHSISQASHMLAAGPVPVKGAPGATQDGGSTALNIMNPYIIVYRWKRQS